MDAVQKELQATPMLFPYPPSSFWTELRKVVQEEIRQLVIEQLDNRKEASRMLYKVKDLCEFFQVSKPTIYEWIREGRLKPFRIGSRVFFKGSDVEEMAR